MKNLTSNHTEESQETALIFLLPIKMYPELQLNEVPTVVSYKQSI